jgi:hypothetical protein
MSKVRQLASSAPLITLPTLQKANPAIFALQEKVPHNWVQYNVPNAKRAGIPTARRSATIV